jgi:hypothetical protein
MEPNRKKYRVNAMPRKQAGLTAIGFLFLAAVFGLIGLGGMRLIPLYLENMRLSTILDDIERDGGGLSPQGIRLEMAKRFSIEGVRIPTESVKISQVRDGYQVHVQYENRAPFIADIWFLVAFDKQVLVTR